MDHPEVGPVRLESARQVAALAVVHGALDHGVLLVDRIEGVFISDG